MVKIQRSDHVFRLTQPHLRTKGLPVFDLENINCWENLHYALLCLDDEQFEVIINSKENLKKKTITPDDIAFNNEKLEQGQRVDTGDKYLNEIEKALAKGDMQSVETLLRNM